MILGSVDELVELPLSQGGVCGFNPHQSHQPPMAETRTTHTARVIFGAFNHDSVKHLDNFCGSLHQISSLKPLLQYFKGEFYEVPYYEPQTNEEFY